MPPLPVKTESEYLFDPEIVAPALHTPATQAVDSLIGKRRQFKSTDLRLKEAVKMSSSTKSWLNSLFNAKWSSRYLLRSSHVR